MGTGNYFLTRRISLKHLSNIFIMKIQREEGETRGLVKLKCFIHYSLLQDNWKWSNSTIYLEHCTNKTEPSDYCGSLCDALHAQLNDYNKTESPTVCWHWYAMERTTLHWSYHHPTILIGQKGWFLFCDDAWVELQELGITKVTLLLLFSQQRKLNILCTAGK